MSLSISGTSSYRLQGGVATVELDRVTYTGTGVSGTVRLELWATTTPYGGGGISGYRIADYVPTANEGRLSAGVFFRQYPLLGSIFPAQWAILHHAGRGDVYGGCQQ